MKISDPEIVRLPFGEKNNEIATVTLTDGIFGADVRTMRHDQSEITSRTGAEILLRTIDPGHIKELRQEPDGRTLFRTLHIPTESGVWETRHFALKGVSVNLCYTDPETVRILGIASVPNGKFTEYNFS